MLAIAAYIEGSQTAENRQKHSEDEALSALPDTDAAEHGSMRHLAGFDLNQVGVEFRSLRATVLRLWLRQIEVANTVELQDIVRFDEGIDEVLAESVSGYLKIVDSSRDTFLAVLGHDLRNPLGALSSCLRLLSRAEADDVAKQKALLIANRSVTVIAEMTTNLLNYTRTRLGHGIEIVPETADFGALCREALEEVQAVYPERVLICDISDDLIANFDPSRMRQVLTNLLCNALQHGDLSSAITLKAQSEGTKVSFAVKNYGAVIPQESLRAIFNPLVQLNTADSAQAQRSSSLGLGLYIAQEIVGRHGGTIDVTSSVEDGTAFVVRIDRE